MRPASILTISLIFLAVIACTDKRKPPPVENQAINLPTGLDLVSTVQFNGQPSQAYQMKSHEGSLYVTGTSFGFSRWDISSDPENPSLTFAMSDNIVDFTQNFLFGAWNLDWVATEALEVFDGYALTSGVSGMSVINISNTSRPVEVLRFPNQSGVSPGSDERYIYQAIVKHPTASKVYGFREQDSLYVLGSVLQGFPILQTLPYVNGRNVCCVEAAAFFNDKLYVAMRSRLWVFNLDASGNITSVHQIDDLQAVNVVATQNYLFVHHEPTSSNFTPLAAGVYVFDSTGTPVKHLRIRPFTFAINEAETHFYSNTNDIGVDIHRIMW